MTRLYTNMQCVTKIAQCFTKKTVMENIQCLTKKSVIYNALQIKQLWTAMLCAVCDHRADRICLLAGSSSHAERRIVRLLQLLRFIVRGWPAPERLRRSIGRRMRVMPRGELQHLIRRLPVVFDHEFSSFLCITHHIVMLVDIHMEHQQAL